MEGSELRNGLATTGPGDSRRLTIAIADDVVEIQQLAKTWLTELGHHVLCADNGRDLLRWCESRRIDVVITDIMMPESDGFEVIRRIRATQPAIKIISMSGGASVMTTEQCLQIAGALGADAVLRKPFRRAQLLAALDSVVGQ